MERAEPPVSGDRYMQLRRLQAGQAADELSRVRWAGATTLRMPRTAWMSSWNG